MHERFIPARAGNAACADWRGLPSVGSSPRVRGTLRTRGRSTLTDRFIPARAGNARSSRLRARPDRFIPARAGNAAVTTGDDRHCDGSSPRVRGTLMRTAMQDGPCIGSSPRVRGTLCLRRTSLDVTIGSSPRVRGTPSSRRYRRVEPVHPRACGERSSCKRLCQGRIHNVKQRTDVPL